MGGPRVKHASNSHSKSAQGQDVGGISDKENRSRPIRTLPPRSGTPGTSKKKPMKEKQDKASQSKKLTPAKSMGNAIEIGDFEKEKLTPAKKTHQGKFIRDNQSDSEESMDSDLEAEVKPVKRKTASRQREESDGEGDETGASIEESSNDSEMETDNEDSRDLKSDYREAVEEAEKQRIKKKRKRSEVETDNEAKGVEKESGKTRKKKKKILDSKSQQIKRVARASAFRFAVTVCMWGEKDDIFWEDPEDYDYTEAKEEDRMTGEEVILGMAAEYAVKHSTEIIRTQAEYFHQNLPKQERRWWFEPSYQDRFMYVFSRVRGNMMAAIDSHAREVFELDISNKVWFANRAGRSAVPGVTELLEDNPTFCYPYVKEGKKKRVIYRHPALTNIARRVLKGPSAMLSTTGERSSKARKTADQTCNIKTFSAPILLFVMTLAHQSLGGYRELNKAGPSENYYWEMMEHLAEFHKAHPDRYEDIMDHFDEALGLGEQKEEKQVVNKMVRKELKAILEESDTEDEKGKGKKEKGKNDDNEGSKDEEKGEEETRIKKQQSDAPSDTQPAKDQGDTGQQRKSPRILKDPKK